MPKPQNARKPKPSKPLVRQVRRKRTGPVPMPEVRFVYVPLTEALGQMLRRASEKTGMFPDEVASMLLENQKPPPTLTWSRLEDEPPLQQSPSPVSTSASKALEVPVGNECYDRLRQLVGEDNPREMGLTAAQLLESAEVESILAGHIKALQDLYVRTRKARDGEREIRKRLAARPRSNQKPR